jgi:NADPH-dependent F420 reductase
MKIGIIGTGNVGGALGKAWSTAGHEVFFGSREPLKAKKLASSANAKVGSIKEAAAFGNTVLLAVNYNVAKEAIGAAGSLDGKILIDCTNPLGSGFGLSIGYTTSAGEEIAKLAKGAKVVKAFNTAFAQVMANTKYGSEKPTMFICGDDAEAKKIVLQLAEDIGFEPVDVGPLKSARYLEPAAALIISLAYGLGKGTDIAYRLIHR